MSEDLSAESIARRSVDAADLRDAIEAAERKFARALALGVFAIVVVVWLLFEAPPGYSIVMAPLALIPFKQALMELAEMKARRMELESRFDGPEGSALTSGEEAR